jgi:hypothetical protein
MFGLGQFEQMLIDLRKVDESVNTQLSNLREQLETTNELLAEILIHLQQILERADDANSD